MRIRIHKDVSCMVDKNRKLNNRSANAEVNIALAAYYAPVYGWGISKLKEKLKK